MKNYYYSWREPKKALHDNMNESKIIKKYQIIILKKMIRDYNSVIKKIEKNNNKMVEEHLSNVGTSLYWKRRELHDVLSKEKEMLQEEIKYIFNYCNILEMLHQHRYEFIEEEIIKMVKGE